MLGGAGGVAAAGLALADARLLFGFLAAAAVLVVGMRTRQSARRLGPLLLLVAALAVAAAAADAEVRAWF